MNSKEQEMLGKHKQRSEDGFNALQKYVIEQKSCNYCGSCISVCPEGSLEMGDENPKLVGECNSCGVCYLACPRTFLPMTSMQQWSFNTDEIPLLGTYIHATLASSNSEKIMEQSPDGGVVTTIFTYLLDNHIVNEVITSGKKHDIPWCYHPKPMVVTDSGDLIDCIDRKYDPNPLLRKRR